MSFSRLLSFSLAITLLTSCVKDEFNSGNIEAKYDFESGIGVPVGYKTFTAEDFFSDNLSAGKIIVEENGLLSLHFETFFQTPRGNEIFSFQDVRLQNTVTNQTGQEIATNELTDPLVIADSLWVPLQMLPSATDTRLDLVVLERFGFSIKTTSLLTSNISFRIIIEDILIDGMPFQRTISSNSELTQQIFEESEIHLESNSKGDNVFLVRIETIIQPSATSEIIADGNQFLNYDFSLTNFAFRTIYGNFGNYQIPFPPEALILDLYDEHSLGSFYFAQPVLKLHTENSIGTPAGLGFVALETETRDRGQLVIEGSRLPDTANPWVYQYPSLTEVGNTSFDSLIVEGNGWNFSEISEFAPDEMLILAELELNPDNDPGQHFIANNSQTQFNLELILPFYGYASALEVSDTIPFNANDFITNDAAQVQQAFFRFYTTNAFPVNFHLQAYIADINYTLIDSFFLERPVIQGISPEDSPGTSNKNEPIIAVVDREKFDLIRQSGTYIISKAYLETSGFNEVPPRNVGIYHNQYLDINLGLVLDLQGSTDNFQ